MTRLQSIVLNEPLIAALLILAVMFVGSVLAAGLVIFIAEAGS